MFWIRIDRCKLPVEWVAAMYEAAGAYNEYSEAFHDHTRSDVTSLADYATVAEELAERLEYQPHPRVWPNYIDNPE